VHIAHFLFDTFRVNLLEGVFCTLFSLTTHGTSLITSGQLGPKSRTTVVPLLSPFRFPHPLKIEMEERPMAKINLRDYYPFYSSDFFVEIPDEISAALLEAERLEKNYIYRRFYNKASYEPKTKESDGTLDAATTNEINEFLTTFFKLYPTATAKELSYYVNDGVLKPVGKNYTFSELINPIYNRSGNQVTV
jgi:hypothetical protein